MGKKSRMKWVNRELKEEKKKSRGKRWILWIFIILLIVALGAGGYLGYKKYKNWKVNNSQTTAEQTKDNQIAVLDTNMGIIKFRLYDSAAPKTVENFVGLASKGYYDGIKFHRVIKDFMIQTGDPLSKDDTSKDKWGTGGESFWGGSLNDEIDVWDLGLAPEAIKSLQDQGYQYNKDLKSINMVPGVVAMANRGPNTNSSQFFIVTEQPQPHLDGKHTVFGQVIVGMDIVKKIAGVAVDSGDKPTEPVIINKITIEKNPSTDLGQAEPAVKVNVEGGNGTINLGDVKVETTK